MTPIKLARLLGYHGIKTEFLGETDGFFTLHFVFYVENGVSPIEVVEALEGINAQKIKVLKHGLYACVFPRSPRITK